MRNAFRTAPCDRQDHSTFTHAADFYTRKAIAYEGYRTSTNPGAGATASTTPTASQIDQDLTLLNIARGNSGMRGSQIKIAKGNYANSFRTF